MASSKDIKRLEDEQRANRRELERLRWKLQRGETGRNVGATEDAFDRRQDADLKFTRKLAAAEEEVAQSA